MEEIWRPIQNWESLYEVSNTGKVRSITRTRLQLNKYGTFTKWIYHGTALKHRAGIHGYLYVNLSDCGKRSTKKLHRLVAETFIPLVDGKDQVNHIDGDKSNNSVSNLEWVTCKENHDHAYATGLKETSKFGAESPNFKGTIIAVDNNGRVVERFAGTRDITEKGYKHKSVYCALSGYMKTYKGLTFKREET